MKYRIRRERTLTSSDPNTRALFTVRAAGVLLGVSFSRAGALRLAVRHETFGPLQASSRTDTQ